MQTRFPFIVSQVYVGGVGLRKTIFWPTWPQHGPILPPKTAPSWGQNGLKIGPKTVLEAKSVPEPILDRFWTDFGSILGRFLVDFGVEFGCFFALSFHCSSIGIAWYSTMVSHG